MRWLVVTTSCLLALAACEGRISAPLPVPDLGARSGTPGQIPDGRDPGTGGSGGTTVAGTGGSGGTGTGAGGSGPVRLDCTGGPHASPSQLRRLSQPQYRNAIRDVFEGKVAPGPAYPRSLGRSDTGYTTEPGLNEFSEPDPLHVMEAAEEVALDVSGALGQLLPCASSSPGSTCLDRFIDTYARRAFRHEVTSEERATLRAVQAGAVTEGASFPESIVVVTAAMLQMPQFLYVAEDAAPEPRQLTGTELATRLSFFLWDSIPDDALLDAARSGELDTAEGVRTQARRLLQDPRADAALVRFFREWTGTSQVSPADKSAEVYPFFTNAFAASMNESFDRFVVAALRDGADLETLLGSPDVWVDSRMAGFFGVTAPASGWARVSLDPARQSGLVTQPAMLASLAHNTEPSYVYRGRFIRRRLLCETIGAPPADAMTQFSTLPIPENPTARETSLAVRSNPGCASCHSLMDPGGLALENFDALGQWRDRYDSGKGIDPADTLVKVDGHEVTYLDHVGMLRALAQEPVTHRCFVQQVFRFAMSRLEGEADGCTLQQMNDSFEASQHRLEDPFLALVSSDAFRFVEDAE